MVLTDYTQNLMHRLQKLLPVSEEEIVQRGITETATARIVELRQRASQLALKYSSFEALEARVENEGVPSDDHTLYTDLLEWRAVQHELSQLTGFLESI